MLYICTCNDYNSHKNSSNEIVEQINMKENGKNDIGMLWGVGKSLGLQLGRSSSQQGAPGGKCNPEAS